MDKTEIGVIANDLLGLRLTDEEAASLAGPLTGLRQLVELIERVPLPYSALPFITPRMGDQWIEEWPNAPEKPEQETNG